MSGYDRKELEKYYTPAWVIEALRDAVRPLQTVYDPAAGDGKVLDVFDNAYGTDISPDRNDIVKAGYLELPTSRHHAIVTNPPYGVQGKLAEAFIEKALSEASFVAMLLRVDFDSASTRRKLFSDNSRFHGKYVLTKRIRWTNIEQADSGPSKNHAWYVWSDKINPLSPFLRYLP